MKRIILTGMVVFILIVAALPTVAIVADRNFLDDSTYSASAGGKAAETSSLKRELRICQPIQDKPQKEECKTEQDGDD